MDSLKHAVQQGKKEIRVGDIVISRDTFTVIAGPCSVESREQIIETAKAVKFAGAQLLRGGAFKPRTSPYSFQGLGKEGLEHLAAARQESGLPIVTEVMDTQDIPLVAQYADVLQIGARNMHNFALLKALGNINRPVILKRGMSATIPELLSAAEYIMHAGNHQVILCERGIRTFENSTRYTLDLNAVPVLQELSNLPVFVDPSHGIGIRRHVPAMAKAAVAAGCSGLLIEVHPHPEQALSDKEQQLDFGEFTQLMAEVRRMRGK
ncbi:MAG TPA: 3-deoxy-7-phosphoheptulonate synthase [Candidatus Nanoarchaeia archaeon]|nr:3-deoxy-7-phosphoheptulonate synthase [Candidatus Nanoarchaeia archaeon]